MSCDKIILLRPENIFAGVSYIKAEIKKAKGITERNNKFALLFISKTLLKLFKKYLQFNHSKKRFSINIILT